MYKEWLVIKEVVRSLFQLVIHCLHVCVSGSLVHRRASLYRSHCAQTLSTVCWGVVGMSPVTMSCGSVSVNSSSLPTAYTCVCTYVRVCSLFEGGGVGGKKSC
jgi:hypothetical protein